MVKNRFRKEAFSFIEILVVIGIVSIIFTFSLVSFSNELRNQMLNSETRKIVSVVERVQKKARSIDKAGCRKLSHYALKFGKYDYSIIPYCSDSSKGIIENYFIDKRLEIVIHDYKRDIMIIDPIKGIVSENCIILRDEKRGVCNSIIINSAGVINESSNTECSCL